MNIKSILAAMFAMLLMAGLSLSPAIASDDDKDKADKSDNFTVAAPLICQCGASTPLDVAVNEAKETSDKADKDKSDKDQDKADKDQHAQDVDADENASDDDKATAHQDADDAKDKADKADDDKNKADKDYGKAVQDKEDAVLGAPCTCPNGSTSFFAPKASAGAGGNTPTSAFREIRGK
ncbi:MAG: hypothetical protein Q9M20_06160 [Mariprofundaceae bacterium]|nr:hypothetical protein [Mariprofundaceae bacterium]